MPIPPQKHSGGRMLAVFMLLSCWLVPLHAPAAGPDSLRADSADVQLTAGTAWKVAGELLDHWHTRPLARAVDLHKFIHQATLGSAHAGLDTAMLRDWFTNEWGAIERSPGEDPAVSLVTEMGNGWCRAHLAAWKSAGHDPEALLAAFLKGWALPPDSALFHATRIAVRDRFTAELNQGAELPDRAMLDSLDVLWTNLALDRWPAVRHSSVYRDAYKPHYRLVRCWDVVDELERAGQLLPEMQPR